METITITTDLANRILSYLANRPFIEVAVLIGDIQKAADPKPEPDK